MNTENNKLIALFMGMVKHHEDSLYLTFKKKGDNQNYLANINGLQYHSDWNWLMEAVEKINVLGYEVLIGRISCQINPISDRENPISAMVCGDISKKIEITFDAVIQFIKWYNEQKQKQN